MTTEPQVLANRQNAASSTGPKTTAGKHRVSGNALRHGLTSQTYSNTHVIQAISKALARDPDAAAPALEVAQLADLILRIRVAKAGAYSDALARITGQSPPETPHEEIEAMALIAAAPDLLKFDEYERKAMSRRRKALVALQGLSL